jgi:uncharacterized membrane protein (UPF0127 family)
VKIVRDIIGVNWIWLFLLLPIFSGCEKESTTNTDIKPRPVISYKTTLPIETITIADQPFIIELASNNQTRQKGLMSRKSLEKNRGMLFLFRKEGDLSFHMNNCLIDIDIAFIKATGEITTIHEMKKPLPGKPSLLYDTKAKSKYALELAAGTFARLGVKEGDIITIPKTIKQISPEASIR